MQPRSMTTGKGFLCLSVRSSHAWESDDRRLHSLRMSGILGLGRKFCTPEGSFPTLMLQWDGGLGVTTLWNTCSGRKVSVADHRSSSFYSLRSRGVGDLSGGLTRSLWTRRCHEPYSTTLPFSCGTPLFFSVFNKLLLFLTIAPINMGVLIPQ